MFGFSFWKVLVLVAVVMVLFFGYRLVDSRMGGAKQGALRKAANPSARAKPEAPKTTDLVHCNACDSFVPSDQRACGRGKCPFPA